MGKCKQFKRACNILQFKAVRVRFKQCIIRDTSQCRVAGSLEQYEQERASKRWVQGGSLPLVWTGVSF